MRDIGAPVSHRPLRLASSPAMTRARRALLPLVLGVSLVPFAFTALWQRSRHWTPVFDLAMIELRVRDAAEGRWPLLGLVGRIGTEEHVGSHPGPLAFYGMAPVYRLAGGTSWAYQAAALTHHAIALVVAVLIGYRRARLPGAVAVAGLLAVVIQGYGMTTLAEAWNPFLPVLWFVVCLVATWSVVAGDRPMLLVAVFAASMCTQTHIPYLAVCAAMLGLGAVACVLVDRSTWRTGLAWFAGAALLGLVLWSPPLIDQVTNDPGNLTVLVDHFGTPPEEPVGPPEGVRLLLDRLDLWHLVVDSPGEPGQFIGVLHEEVPVRARGVATLAVWAVAAGASVVLLRRRTALVALHVVVGVSLPVAWVALSRIFGLPMYYLMLWVWSLCALAGVAIAWTAVELALRALPAPAVWRPRAAMAVTVAGIVLITGLSVRLLFVPYPLAMGQEVPSEQLRRLLPDTLDGLEAAGGREGRWLVTWTDVAYLGSQGYGLVNELERAGFDVGVIEYHRLNFLDHRYLPTDEADGKVHLATGQEVERWAAVPGAVQIAYDLKRTPAQQRRFEELYAQIEGELRDAGYDDLVDKLASDLWSTGSDRRLSGFQALAIGELQQLGVEAAVFVLPADAVPVDGRP